MKDDMEALIHHFKLFTEGMHVPAGRGLRGGRAPEGRVRHLPDLRRRQQAVPPQVPRAGLRAPGGARRDGRAATCSPTSSRSSARRTSCSGRSTDERDQHRSAMTVTATRCCYPSTRVTKIDHWIAKFPADQQALGGDGGAARRAGREQGWLPPELMDAVAEYLGMPPVAVYEVATLLLDVRDASRSAGTTSAICTNLPCALHGARTRPSTCKKKLGIGFGESTADGRVHAEGRRVPRRLRRRADDAGQQQAHVRAA